jgi:ketosteroid isomerase-like protein
VEIVRHCLEAWAGAHPEESLDLLAEDVVFDVRGARPDGRVWHGRDGVRQAMVEWTGTWDDWSVQVDQIIDIDDERVLLLWRESGRGKGSGLQMHQSGASITTVRNGQIVSFVPYLDRAQAFADAGIEPPG